MSTRAGFLSKRFEESHNDVLELAWATSEKEWSRQCLDTGWPVGGVFRHIARSYLIEIDCAAAFVSQSPFPSEFIAWERLDRWNTQFAINRPKDETVTLLQTAGITTRAFIGALSDEQLDYVRYFPLADTDWSAEEMVEYVLIAHPEPHLEEIRAALAQGATVKARDHEPARSNVS